MRYLALTRGMPFCGKSKWIRDNNLQNYTLSIKDFKVCVQGPMMNSDGLVTLLNAHEKVAYQMMFIALESRMQRGEFIIIEDSHVGKSYLSNYKQLANLYNYELLVIDFTYVGLDEIKKRADFKNRLVSSGGEISLNFKVDSSLTCKALGRGVEPHNFQDDVKILDSKKDENLESENTVMSNEIETSLDSKENAMLSEAKSLENDSKDSSVATLPQNDGMVCQNDKMAHKNDDKSYSGDKSYSNDNFHNDDNSVMLSDSETSLRSRENGNLDSKQDSSASLANDKMACQNDDKSYSNDYSHNDNSHNDDNSVMLKTKAKHLSSSEISTQNLDSQNPTKQQNTQSQESKHLPHKESTPQQWHDEIYFHYTHEELEEIYRELKSHEIPIKCTSLNPEEFMDYIATKPVNLNGYKAIHHIGDIQGSFWVLNKYLENMKDDEFYIFLGDYIDRGIQNYEVLRFLLKISNKNNVCFLEGNHEKWLWEWANGREVESREFRLNTQNELEKKGFSRNDGKKFYKLLKPFFFYKYHEKKVICTHGGVANMVENWNLLSASQCIGGVGGYLNTSLIAKTFSQNTSDDCYQFFGHRNRTELPINVYERNFIMESKVEFGGYLRAVVLNQSGFQDKSLKNSVFVNKSKKEEKELLQRFIDNLSKNKKASINQRGNMLFVEYDSDIKDILESPFCFYPCIIDSKEWELFARGRRLDSDLSRKYSLLEFEKYSKELKYPIKIFRNISGTPLIISIRNGEAFYFKDSSLIHPLPLLSNRLHKKKIKELFKGKSYSLILTMQGRHSIVLHDIVSNDVSDTYMPNVAHIAKEIGISYQNALEEIEDREALERFMNRMNAHNLALSQRNENEIYLQDLYDSNGFEMFNGFVMQGSNHKYINLSSYYDKEIRVIENFLRIWHVKGTISKLQWINNPLRQKFFSWFKEYARENPAWSPKDLLIIKNSFLASVL